MVAGRVQYAVSDGVHVAYQVVGEEPRDLIVLMEGFIPVDTMDDEPRLARCMSRLNTFARLIRFDRRGIGLSDPVSPGMGRRSNSGWTTRSWCWTRRAPNARSCWRGSK